MYEMKQEKVAIKLSKFYKTSEELQSYKRNMYEHMSLRNIL